MAEKARKSARDAATEGALKGWESPLNVGMIHKDDPVGRPMYPPYSTPSDPQGLLPKNRPSGLRVKHD